MSAPLSTYSAEDNIFVFNGIPASATADGEFLKVSRNNDSFTLTVGADGSPARAANADKSGTFVLTLLQTSPMNDILSAQLALDELTKSATSAAQVTDLRGTTKCSGNTCWVRKFADVTLEKGVSGREWTIETGKLQMFVGGDA